MFGFYILNNVSIGFRSFAGGIIFGLGTIFFLVFNGLILGGVVALPFALSALLGDPGVAWWLRIGGALGYLSGMPPVTAYLALNFTGSTTFTSKTGVRREIFTYIPVMAGMFGTGVVLLIASSVIKLLGGSS